MRKALPLILALCLAPAWAQDDDEDDPFARLYGDEDEEFSDDDLPEDPVERAMVLLDHGRHDEAEALFGVVLAEDDEDYEALEGQVRLLLKSGRDDEVVPLLPKLEELDRTRFELFSGILAEHRGELDPAIEHFQAAFALAKATPGPHRLEALVRMGELLAGKDVQKAGATFEQVLQLYSAQDSLTAPEFVWVARACRRLDVFPEVKKGYAKGMVEYSRRMLDQAQLADSTYTGCYVEAGELALAKYDTVGALKSFEKACKLDPNSPQARVGLARSLTEAFYRGQGRYESAASNLKAALAVNPNYAPAHATLAATAITDGLYDQAEERLEIGLRARPADVDLLAYQAALPMLRGDKEAFQRLEAALLAKRPRCARFYEVIADLIGSKRFRYAEARDLARKGLVVRPGYHPLLTILGMNLTRTNQEEEGLRLLKQAFEEDPYNVFTFNYLQLFDRLEEKYVSEEIPGFVVRMHKDEEVIKEYVYDLLYEARRELAGRYKTIPETVLVEFFPNHNDFSSRSVGLPGMPILGVCFGNTMTVLSRGDREKPPFHAWGRTLWHEFAHVATLTRTANRTPRWFTEGLSVYEESLGRPNWARTYDADIMGLLANQLLLPIARLDEGFTKPKYGNQVIMSYYQGGITCEFIVARWGFDTILSMLDGYRAGKLTPEVIRTSCGLEPEDFDAEFRAWLERRFARYAYTPPPWPNMRQAWARHVEESPWDVGARGRLAWANALHGRAADAELHAGIALEHGEAALARWDALSEVDALGGTGDWSTLAVARVAALRAGIGDAHLALALTAKDGMKQLRHARIALRVGTRDPVLAYRLIAGTERSRKNFAAALKAQLEVVRLSPPKVENFQLLAAIYAQLGKTEQAMLTLEKVCTYATENVKVRLQVAAWAKEQGRWAMVARVLDDMALIDPFEVESHVMLGDALRETWAGHGEAYLQRVEREYRIALALETTYRAACHYGRGWALAKLGKTKEALEQVDAALQDDPDHAGAQALKQELGGAKK